MLLVTGGSQGRLSGQPVWRIQGESLCGQSVGCFGSWVKRRVFFLGGFAVLAAGEDWSDSFLHLS